MFSFCTASCKLCTGPEWCEDEIITKGTGKTKEEKQDWNHDILNTV